MTTIESKAKELLADIPAFLTAAERSLAPAFAGADAIAQTNTRRVLDAFRALRLSEEFFAGRTGYGIDDPAREVIDAIFARCFGAEAAAVRMQIVSGTHALACAILGNLKAGDRLVCLTGKPYDTLLQVLGLVGSESGSLAELGCDYSEIDLCPDSEVDFTAFFPAHKEALVKLLAPPTKLAYIQKSCGYSFSRRSLSNAKIEVLCQFVREINPDICILVDNCYGEFVEADEPTTRGADLIAGSLIKNPGGGLAISGGYIAGRKVFVDRALNRLTAPGIGGHLGLTFNQNRLLLQGLFCAPAVVCGAVKGAHLVASVFGQLGLPVAPKADQSRFDIIQAVSFGSPDRLSAFLKAVQKASPVDAHVVPEPALMPGYQDQVLMAGGTFVEGSTIEFSADGPLREPYVAFIQGGLSYTHVRVSLEQILDLIAKDFFIG